MTREGKVAMVGCGSWGTALSAVLGSVGWPVSVWDGEAAILDGIDVQHANPRYLTECSLPECITTAHRLSDCLRDADVVVIALPAAAVRQVCTEAVECLRATDCTIVSATKGLEPTTAERMTQLIASILGPDSLERLAALSGPNLAAEVVRWMPTATVVAGSSPERLAQVQELFNTPRFRVYTSADPIGVELGGALKNVIALAAGTIDGLGFGENTKASLITRGLAEISRAGVALGARPETFMGLSGLGDLVATCGSRNSRNWRIGYALGQGVPLDQAIAELGMVAEGVPTTRAARVLSRHAGVEMPIASQVHATLFEGKPPREATEELMSRPPKEEC